MKNISAQELQFVIPEELFFFKEDIESASLAINPKAQNEVVAQPEEKIQAKPPTLPIALKGNFSNGILVIHEEDELKPDVMEMLVNLIRAIGHSMNEVGLVSSKNLENRSLEDLYDLNAHKVLKFGRIKHPINAMPATDYQIHMEQETEYLFADALSTISEDNKLKSKLWNTLQVLFNISKK